MDLSLFKTLGQIAGIGGIALGVVFLVFRELIRKSIFPTLDPDDAYKLVRLIVVLVFLLGFIGIAAWGWAQHNSGQGDGINGPSVSNTNQANGGSTTVTPPPQVVPPPPILGGPLEFTGSAAKGVSHFRDDGPPGPSCRYTVTMTGTRIRVKLNSLRNELTSGTIDSLMTEQAQDCDHGPNLANMHHYVLTSATIQGDMISADFSNREGNVPRANAHFAGSIAARDISGTLTINRTDSSSNLDWSVVVPVTLRAN